ncbi:hypothetical protein NL341_28395, partial [Klebsiella pneumoniae]|nr:hypothetical protein [Klebsiella pneumoniae]
LADSALNFHQTQALTEKGIAMHKYGALLIPESQKATTIQLEADIDGTVYKASTATISAASDVGDTVVLTKQGN